MSKCAACCWPGIVIGSYGVLDDVTVTHSATGGELARANPKYRFRQLCGAATRIGRAHIASVINTIVLAYAAADAVVRRGQHPPPVNY